jgi:hypothetical protein
VLWDRTQEAIQAIVDEAPKAKWYFSDGFDVCFSRCPYALSCALRLFVTRYNHRQLKSRLYPAYSFNWINFVHSPN